MIISEIMIIGFSLYWVRSQYQKEKSNLTKELYGYYKESYNDAVDSLLIEYLIEPSLGENRVFYGNRNHTGQIIKTDSKTLFTTIINSDSLGTKSDKIFRLRISENIDSVGNDSQMEIANTRDSILLRSLRLIIEKSADTISHKNGLIAAIGKGPDSMIFIRDYKKRLQQNRLNIKPVWAESDSITVNHRAIIMKDWTGSLPPVVIKKSNSLLMREILPQIIFSFIMVLVSSLAFLLAYYSIRKQIRLNDMRNNFISNISHELKTPVSTVKIAIEALKKYDSEGYKNGKTSEYLEMAGKEIKRLELLISKVLDHSIIEEDYEILRFEDVNIVNLIDDAVKSLQARIEAVQARISYDHPGEMIIRSDPLYLQGVIINLLDNSLKYGNGNPEIKITLSADEKYTIIRVTDNGPGIPEEYRQRVFDKFFRVPSRDLHNVKGYGLGLSFAQLIVKMHQGSIEIKNNDPGCTFTIKIPFEKH